MPGRCLKYAVSFENERLGEIRSDFVAGPLLERMYQVHKRGIEMMLHDDQRSPKPGPRQNARASFAVWRLKSYSSTVLLGMNNLSNRAKCRVLGFSSNDTIHKGFLDRLRRPWLFWAFHSGRA